MITGRILAFVLVAAVAGGGVSVAAIGDDGDRASDALRAIDVRKDDAQGDVELVADDDPDDNPTGDGDKTRGDDGTSWGHNHDHDSTAGDDGTRGGDNSDGDRTAGDDGTSWGHNDDHDSTAGDDGTSGGDNSSYVVAAAAPEPAPAPAYDDYSDDGGYAVSGS